MTRHQDRAVMLFSEPRELGFGRTGFMIMPRCRFTRPTLPGRCVELYATNRVGATPEEGGVGGHFRSPPDEADRD
jgi:hypothetical protein